MLRNSVIGEVLIELLEIDSTNNYAMRLINEGMAEHGMTIRADYQTEGRGQQGKNWLSEESKNLLFTTILDTTGFSIQKQFILNTFTCLSVAEFLMTNIGLREVSIKWPNDIYAENKKIAGILIENIIRGTNSRVPPRAAGCRSAATIGVANQSRSQADTAAARLAQKFS